MISSLIVYNFNQVIISWISMNKGIRQKSQIIDDDSEFR